MNSSGFTFTRVKDQMIQQLLDMGIKDFRVLDALSQVPRHIFLDQALWSRAYENRALTIGYKQTISLHFGMYLGFTFTGSLVALLADWIEQYKILFNFIV